ncbi:MAG: retroviral-like aspartic protease [Nitrosopumilus sp.]|nr:retroviral-like aspartic protease [Nitrosopumilus sp.]
MNSLIKINVIIDDKLKVKAVYDSGSNISLINQKIVDDLKLSLMNNKKAFKTISGFDFSSARANILLKIGNLTDSINTYVVKNNNFSYDLLLGLDAIKKFKLLQDESLNILQRFKNKIITIEKRDQMNNNKNNTMLNSEQNLQNLDNKISANMNDTFDANLNHIEEENKKKNLDNKISANMNATFDAYLDHI